MTAESSTIFIAFFLLFMIFRVAMHFLEPAMYEPVESDTASVCLNPDLNSEAKERVYFGRLIKRRQAWEAFGSALLILFAWYEMWPLPSARIYFFMVAAVTLVTSFTAHQGLARLQRGEETP
jgi:hypothetical protein